MHFEKAGPREQVFFDPKKTTAAIVTCGGLCPGINNVIRSFVLEAYHRYGIKNLLGIRHGYRGLNVDLASESYLEPIALTPQTVSGIHNRGGTILGTSRGPQDPKKMVQFLRDKKIDILICVGGDGTQRGMQVLAQEARDQGLSIAIVGIPKTIDNDIPFTWRTFGYFTAIDKACEVIRCAHVEATSAPKGIGLVKVMGRHAGFIAAGATLASQEVNAVLVPEISFDLEGKGGLLSFIEKRLQKRDHAVIVVAEGAGQEHIPDHEKKRDASGNIKLSDIGVFLQNRILSDLAQKNIEVTLKYIDPSYIIRGVPANLDDSLLCDALARNALHAAMAGKTQCLIGYWHNQFIHVPVDLATMHKRQLDPEGSIWSSVLAATGQPERFA